MIDLGAIELIYARGGYYMDHPATRTTSQLCGVSCRKRRVSPVVDFDVCRVWRMQPPTSRCIPPPPERHW